MEEEDTKEIMTVGARSKVHEYFVFLLLI